jgi:DNA mismatch repair ATPase MutL
LTEAGFYYNIIGRQLLELDRCPVFFESKLGLEYFWQIVEQKKELQRINKFTAMCAMKACKTAVVVGNPLRYGEMRQIVKNLADLESPWNCPHGRPTLVQLGKRITFRNKVTLPRTMKRYDF